MTDQEIHRIAEEAYRYRLEMDFKVAVCCAVIAAAVYFLWRLTK